MKLADLAARIASKSGITAAQAQDAINAFKEVIAEELKANDKFYLYGLGTFQVQTRKARRGRNPKTGQLLEIPSKRAIKWSSSRPFDSLAGIEIAKRAQPIAETVEKPAPIAPPPPPTPDVTPSIELSPMDITPDILARDLEASTTAATPAPSLGPPPVLGAADEQRMVERARRMAKVNIEDLFLYNGDAIVQAVANGQDPHEVVGEQLEQARSTMVRRVGETIASKEDFVGIAFQNKLDSLQTN